MDVLRDGAIAVLTTAALLASPASASAGDAVRPHAACPDPSPIVAGISQLVSGGAPGPVFALDPDVVPIVSGDEDTPVPSTFVLVGVSGAGRVLAMGHDGLITNGAIGLLDNRRFARQALEWLDATYRRALGVTSGHGETMRDEWSDSLRATMIADGWTAGTIPDQISAEALAPYSVVLVSNAAGLPPTEAERAALLAFVQSGGGLILQGLGWGWAAYHPGMELSEYPMNQIGAMFGIQWIGGSIDDPTEFYEGSTVFHRFYPDLPAPSSTAEALDMIRATNAAHVADLGPALQCDAVLRTDYTRAHLFLRGTEQALPAEDPGRVDFYEQLRDALNASGAWFHRTASYDPAQWPAMAWLRERAARTLADAAPLTAARIAEIASALGLWGPYAHLWSEHRLLVLDNLGMDGENLAYVGALMDSIPATMHDLRSISVRDYLGDTDPPVPLDGVGAGAVNVFAAAIGANCEDQFPPDAPERGWADLFCVVVAHEVNHVVDAWLASTQPWFRAFRDTCLARAGTDPVHYLRTMGESEFFAGTANQWFTDSWLTVRLGIVRYQAGIPWPVDQAYLFVVAYANGDPFTRFYHSDPQGHFTMARAPVTRDAQGRITDLEYQGHHVHFELAADGHVAGVVESAVDVPWPQAGAGPRLVAFPNPARDRVAVRLEGVRATSAEVTLYDAGGRQVAARWTSSLADGPWWLDCEDDRGGRLAAGLYLMRVRVEGRTLTTRLVVLD
jgi:hypothetical protein